MRPYCFSDKTFRDLWRTEKTYPVPPADPAQPGGWQCGLAEERQAWWFARENLKPNTGQAEFSYYFRCPSDDRDDPTAKGVLYAVHIANFTYQRFVGTVKLGRTNYAGVAGAIGDCDPGIPPEIGNPRVDLRQWIGPMYNRSTLTLGQIKVQDGTEHTLLFGESLGGSVVNGRDLAWSWFGVGAMGTAYGLGRANVPAPIDPPPLGSVPPSGQDGAAWYRFSSRHPHVVQFCLADCSTIALRYGKTTIPDLSGDPPGNNSSDWALLQQLAGRKDGFKNDIANLLEEGSTLK
jgi:hypothetical protein